VLFNNHSQLAGRHAFLSPSKYHWMNYTEDKLARMYIASQAAQRGSELHALAHELIRLNVKLPQRRTTLNTYVNDAIGYRMTPEQILYYSDNCFGTADAIGFRRNLLRIHDLKTGVTRTSEHQLEVYAALFCLEYQFRPVDIAIEMRIYQNDDIQVFVADPDLITHLMSTIVAFDKRIAELRMEGI
jgi:hypothetical protein